jgi:hypothetical protein
MATLLEISNLILGAPTLRQRFLAGRVKAAWDILNESPSTTNHANRLIWSVSVLDTYEGHAQNEYTRFLSNPTIQASGNSSTDNDIQFVVNSMVDAWADSFVGEIYYSSSSSSSS